MKYMLDTNICIYAIKHKPPEVIKNFLKHDPDDMCICQHIINVEKVFFDPG